MYLPIDDRIYLKNTDLCSNKGEIFKICLSEPKDNTFPLKAGYGACYKCSCKAFEGNGQQCSNCGHSYSDHW